MQRGQACAVMHATWPCIRMQNGLMPVAVYTSPEGYHAPWIYPTQNLFLPVSFIRYFRVYIYSSPRNQWSVSSSVGVAS